MLRRGIKAAFAPGSAEGSLKPAEPKHSVNTNLWTMQKEAQEASLVKRDAIIWVRMM